jgi:hypothetical protein
MESVMVGEQMNEAHVYLLQYRGGRPDVRFVPNEEMQKHGGTEAFETSLAETAIWFYPVGTIRGRLGRDGWPRKATKRVGELLQAWVELGCPRVMGRIGTVARAGDTN